MSERIEKGALSDDLALVRRFIEENGYEIVVMSDGNRSAVPMDTAAVTAALDRLVEAGFHGE